MPVDVIAKILRSGALVLLAIGLTACNSSSDAIVSMPNPVLNVAPTANAGPDQSVLEQIAVNLDGTVSSDPEGPIATYSWLQTAGMSVVLNNGNTATPDFTAPPVASPGETLTFELTVTDSDSVMNSDTVDIQVDPDPALNVLPTADAGPDQTVIVSVIVTLDGSASSDDGAITAYQWAQTVGPGVILTNANQVMATFTAPAAPVALTFQLSVTDDEGGMVTDSVAVNVTGQITVSGLVQFQEVPHGAGGFGLDYASTLPLPVRIATVEAIDAADDTTVLATTKTDVSGNYSLNIDSNTNAFIRVRAENIETAGPPTWDVRVVDNTNSNALYTMVGADFNSGVVDRPNEDLLALSGWDGASYSGTRVAAPFAVLDATYMALQLVLSADATAVFPPLLMRRATA